MADDAAAADDARAKAEARRQRILDRANKRMGVVSGEMALGEEEKKQSTSNAARIRAARHRRYGKKTQQDTTTSQKDGEDGESSRKVEDGQKEVDGQEDATNKDTPPSSEKQEDAASSNQEKAMEPPKMAEEPKSEEVTADKSKTVAETTIVADDKTAEETMKKETSKRPEAGKKYLGVARMRRKKLMEQKAKEEQEPQTTTVESSDATNAAVAKEVVKPVVTKARAIPIFMYTLTILLLFLAGFDFGLQQYHGQVIVHRELSPKDFPSRFNKLNPATTSSIESLSGSNSFNRKGSDPSLQENDEFEDEPIVEEEAKIDPMFGVDLDELTKGPGLLMFFARGAVAVHRLLLFLFYFGPRNFILAIFELPKALMETPPMLCFIALLVRQVIGKGILKAEIPSHEKDDKDSSIDILSMVKNGVTNFLKSAFPTAVVLYTAFFDLRSDMYIIIFGAMCGMIWANTTKGGLADDVDGISAEL